MKETIIEAKKLIALGEEFSEYEMKDVVPLDFDEFVYKYETEPYEGSGFAVWKKGDKYFYHELGHCSCDGPTNGIEQSNNVPFTLEQIETIAEKSYCDGAKEVVAYFKK